MKENPKNPKTPAQENTQNRMGENLHNASWHPQNSKKARKDPRHPQHTQEHPPGIMQEISQNQAPQAPAQMCTISCLLILLGVNVLAALVFYFWDPLDFALHMLNFEMGFLGFLFINLANFWGLKNRITKEADSLRSLPKEQKKQKSSRLFLGLRISGLWTRILAYALFGWGLYALMHSGRFSFVSCAIGIALSLFGILFLQFLQLKKQ